MAASEALEKAKPPQMISTPEEYRTEQIRWAEKKYNVLTPFTRISGLAPHHGIFYSLVIIEPDKVAGEVYDSLPFLKKDEVALAKLGLRKLADDLGISTQTMRVDTRMIPHYWEYKCICSYRGVDGSVVTREATKEWDLRDGSPQLKGWTANQIEEGRKHGGRNCEARAINAAIRECGCGIKQRYTREELKRPFVAVRVAFLPDMTDPDIKRIVTERALSGTSALYQGPAFAASAPSLEVEERPLSPAPRSVGQGSTAEADPNQTPPSPNAVRLVEIKELHGTSANTGKKWTKWLLIDHHGVEHSTFSTTHRDAAQQLMESKAWVDIDEEQSEDGKYTNVVNVGLAQPSLLPDPDQL